MRIAARILAASKGDRGIKRELLESHNEIIARQKNWSRGYANRGDLYYKLGDLRQALKDYRQCVKLSRNGQVDGEVQVSIARCLALQGKHRDAAEELNRSNVSIRTLKELGEDPDFREMALMEKYRSSVFRLPALEDGE